MSPLFRFTLNNSILGPLVITEPGGWDESLMKLQRNEEYHSIVEVYEQPLTFSGTSIEGNGGLEYIREAEEQGPDSQISINIELSEDDGDTYSLLFNGLLKISTIHEHDFYVLECGVIRNDLWSKFMNRKSTPVDLSSTTDLDGGTRSAVSPFTLSLPSQKTRKNYNGYLGAGTSIYEDDIAVNDYIQFDFDTITISEVETKYNLSIAPNVDRPVSLIDIAEDGDYTFTTKIEMGIVQQGGGTIPGCAGAFATAVANAYITVYFQINDDTPIVFTETNHSPGFQSTEYSYAATHTLKVGDQIRMYGIMPSDAWKFPISVDSIVIWGFDNTAIPIKIGTWTFGGASCLLSTVIDSTQNIAAPSGNTIPTFLTIVADTTYLDTDCEAFQIGAAAESIVSKLVGQNSVISSNYILSSNCGAYYALTRGLNVRGYSLTDKPFTMSFDDWWAGANPVLNLGLGYNGSNIEILKKDDFYNPIPIINFDYVNKVERSYNDKTIFKSIEIGYEKWSAESDSGVDDPQTKHTYRTRYQTSGNDIQIKSKFFAASLGIEQTRRNRAEQGKDWRLDEDVIIMALKVGVSRPELGSDLSAVSDLLNSATRYNIRISPAWNFRRWKAFLNGGQFWYTTNEDFYFASGEGNIKMSSTRTGGDCEFPGQTAVENADIDGGAAEDFLFLPIVYEFEYPLTFEQYKLIRSNPKNAIGISRTNTGHVACFITELAYQPTHGKGKFTVILGQSTPL